MTEGKGKKKEELKETYEIIEDDELDLDYSDGFEDMEELDDPDEEEYDFSGLEMDYGSYEDDKNDIF